MILQVESAAFYAGNYSKVTLDDVHIQLRKNSSGHYRGVHIILINPISGKVEFAKVFDTYKSSIALNNFIESKMIKEGTVVVVSCKDDCYKNFSD